MLRLSLFLMAMILAAGAEDALPLSLPMAPSPTLDQPALGDHRPKAARASARGFNEGNREQFKNCTRNTAHLVHAAAVEIESWYPTRRRWLQVSRGARDYGPRFNLDGKVGPNDFTSPEGERGIDSQLYRALGCIKNYRGRTAPSSSSTTRKSARICTIGYR
jgi:hypothetical protein